MPQPGSPAFHARQERLRKKGKLVESEPTPAASDDAEEDKGETSPQRQQPVSKNRAKKKKKK
jgi:YidC/Oxa1 family membrane protein insertase